MLPFASRLCSSPSRTLHPSLHPALAKFPPLLFSRAREKLFGTVSSRLSSSLPSRFQTRLFQTLWQRRRQASSPLNLEIAIAWLREEEAILKAAQNLKDPDKKRIIVCDVKLEKIFDGKDRVDLVGLCIDG